MAILERFPPAVSSAEELAALAEGAQRHALKRYEEFEALMRSEQQTALAESFAFLAKVGETEAQETERLSPGLFRSGVNSLSAGTGLGLPFDDDAETSSRLLTPYRVLALAVRHAEQSFAFFSYVAAGASDERTRMLAEGLAKIKLTEAWRLRRERRRAFHDDRQERAAARPIPGSLSELDEETVRTEWHAAQYHHELSQALQASDPAIAKILSDTADDEKACARVAAARSDLDLVPGHGIETPTKYGALRLLEAAFERYTEIAERAKDEDVLREAQSLAQRVVFRFGLTRALDDRFVQ